MIKQTKMDSKFTVFEITQGWYLKEQDAFVIESGIEKNSNSPYIREPANQQWYFRNGKPTVNEVKITTSLWEAEKFNKEEIKLYEEGLKSNFSEGVFKDISATINVQFAQ